MRGENPCTREVGAPMVRGASVTRMGNSFAVFIKNFLGTNEKKFSKNKKFYLTSAYHYDKKASRHR